jgi:hypothetical protein
LRSYTALATTALLSAQLHRAGTRYLDHFATNESVSDAKVRVTIGDAEPVDAEPDGERHLHNTVQRSVSLLPWQRALSQPAFSSSSLWLRWVVMTMIVAATPCEPQCPLE